MSADQFDTVLDKEKYFCDNDTFNVETEAEELTATGRPKRHAEKNIDSDTDDDNDARKTGAKKPKETKGKKKSLPEPPPAVCLPPPTEPISSSSSTSVSLSSSAGATIVSRPVTPSPSSLPAPFTAVALAPVPSAVLPTYEQPVIVPSTPFQAHTALASPAAPQSAPSTSTLRVRWPRLPTQPTQLLSTATNVFQSQVLQALLSLSNTVNDIKHQLDFVTSVVRDMHGQADAEEALPLPEGMSLPLKSDSEVESFDATLEQDVGLRKALIKRLMRLGGRSVELAIKLQLKFLLSPAAQKVYSWFGRKGKKPFGTLVLASVVSKAVRRNRRLQATTDEDLRTACARFFTGARDRRDTTDQRSSARQQRIQMLVSSQQAPGTSAAARIAATTASDSDSD